MLSYLSALRRGVDVCRRSLLPRLLFSLSAATCLTGCPWWVDHSEGSSGTGGNRSTGGSIEFSTGGKGSGGGASGGGDGSGGGGQLAHRGEICQIGATFPDLPTVEIDTKGRFNSGTGFSEFACSPTAEAGMSFRWYATVGKAYRIVVEADFATSLMLLDESTGTECGEVLSCAQGEDFAGQGGMGGTGSGLKFRTILEVTSANAAQRIVLAAEGATQSDWYYLWILPLPG